MVNDLTTLTGALVECKDQLIYELGQQGVTVSFDPSTGLLGLISHIADISGGGATVDSLTLTTNKSILSYADSETATITITAYDSNNDPVPNAQILLFINTTYYDTITTNSNGIATKTYNSQANGDIKITAITNNAYTSTMIEDCTYYNTNTITTNTTVNIPLPTSFEISFTAHRYQISNNASYIEVGGETGNTALFGQIGGTGISRLRIYRSEGGSSYDDYTLSDNPLNQDTEYVWRHFEDYFNIIKMNSNQNEAYNKNVTYSKIRKLSVTNNSMTNLKIKPLPTQ